MIKQLPEEFTSITLGDGIKAPHNDSFKELRRKVREIIDQTNAQYEAIQRIIGRQHRHLSDDHKKPKSTNIALRQRIAELEQALKEIAEIAIFNGYVQIADTVVGAFDGTDYGDKLRERVLKYKEQ